MVPEKNVKKCTRLKMCFCVLYGYFSLLIRHGTIVKIKKYINIYCTQYIYRLRDGSNFLQTNE